MTDTKCDWDVDEAPEEPRARCRSGNTALPSVLFVTEGYIFSGLERHLIDLVVRMDQSRPTILCIGKDLFSERVPLGAAIEVVHCGNKPRFWWNWAALLRRLKPDIVVFLHGDMSHFRGGAYVGARVAGIKRVVSVHHLVPPVALPPPVRVRSLKALAIRILGWRTRELLSLRWSRWACDSVICVSDAICKGLLTYGYPRSKMIVVHNGVSSRDFAPARAVRDATRQTLGIAPEETVFICVARLSSIKGFDVLLPAMAEAKQRGVRCRCLIVGEGPLREEMVQTIEQMGLSHCISLLGFAADVRPYLCAADIFILTSYREGLPLSLLEAMACGLPSIVTDVGGNHEAVTSGKEGYIVPVGASPQLVNAIVRLTEDAATLSQMRTNALQRVCTEFDLDTQMVRVEKAIIGAT